MTVHTNDLYDMSLDSAAGTPGLLSVKEVGKILNISKSTLYRIIARGTLPHLRISSALRFSPADLEQYLTSCRVAAVGFEDVKTSLRIEKPDNG